MSRYQRLRAKNARRTLARGDAADSGDEGTAAARAAQLAVQAPHLMREQDVQTLQATAGNKAVQRALSWDQADWAQTKSTSTPVVAAAAGLVRRREGAGS